MDLRNVKIPVLKNEALEIIKNSEYVSFIIATTNVSNDKAILNELIKSSEEYHDKERLVPYDFKFKTEFGNRKWFTELEIHKNKTLEINVYENKSATENTSLVSDCECTGYEILYWLIFKL